MSWRAARSLLVLRGEVNSRWPKRSKAADGLLGDQAHQGRPSQHNPNSAGVVTAMDITVGSGAVDGNWYSEHLRRLGITGHPALKAGAYIIFNRRIASADKGWTWRSYIGTNPHTGHVHLTVSRAAAGYDATTPWGIDDHGDDFMPALTDAEQRELLTRVRNAEQQATTAKVLAASVDQRCERLERSIHGVDNDSKGKSLFIKMTYLAAETIDGVKGPMLDRTLRKFGAP